MKVMVRSLYGILRAEIARFVGVRGALLCAALLAVLMVSPASAAIVVGQLKVELDRIVHFNNRSILADHLDLGVPPDGSGRIFLAEKGGRIKTCAATSCTIALDLSGEAYTSGAQGLLGFTFHPDFADPLSAGFRKLYTHHTVLPGTHPGATVDFPSPPALGAPNHHILVTEWQMSSNPLTPNVVDVSTRREVFRESHVGVLHSGGAMTWGPDGYLYGSIGTPAVGVPQHMTSQDLNTMYGKLYRIDPTAPGLTALLPDGITPNPNAVSANGKYRVPANNPFVGAAGLDEIFAYGFRHPFRFSVDNNGLVFVGDVGQGSREEVSVITAGDNAGWPYREGTGNFNQVVAPDPPGLTDPVAEYNHADGRSVIGGFVYRGSNPAMRALRGKYIFGEFSWDPANAGGFNAFQGRLLWIDPYDENGNVNDLSENQIQEIYMGPTTCANSLNPSGDCSLDVTMPSIAQDDQGELYLIGWRGSSRMIVYKVVGAFVPEPASASLLAMAMIPLALRRRTRAA